MIAINMTGGERMHTGQIGANYLGDGRCEFLVWAPLRERVEVKIITPQDRIVPLRGERSGYWRGTVKDLHPGSRYLYRLDGEKERPDPASRFQPEGVHSTSQVVDLSAFAWGDSGWKGITLRDFVIYELHVGTFTQDGTFDAIIPRLDYLKELGITVIELMPIAQFPGTRNWGYDGVYPYAVQHSYGGPEGLMRLVNACHRTGLAVSLDVVYNHLGPEGNYLADFGPYFTGSYRTPWGEAINFDGPYSDDVRSYFIKNALHWVRDFHVDALRIDAIHGIFDFSAKHFLRELGEAVHHEAEQQGRNVYVIPESDLNDIRVLEPVNGGGFGLDAQWNDDFHHALHTLLTNERSGYYEDFGNIEYLGKAFKEGFVYSGQYSKFRKRRHGSSSKDIPARRFVVFSQNHDQVGNRPQGERLSSLVSFEQLKLAAGVVLLSPFIPLLFMGEEYGETAPFQYFVDHSDPDLLDAVRRGRSEDFASHGLSGNVPDPREASVFIRSKINFTLHAEGEHRVLLDFYARLLQLRRSRPSLSDERTGALNIIGFEEERVLLVLRRSQGDDAMIICVFADRELSLPVAIPEGEWIKVLDSSSASWGGSGERSPEKIVSNGKESVLQLNPHSIVFYEVIREER